MVNKVVWGITLSEIPKKIKPNEIKGVVSIHGGERWVRIAQYFLTIPKQARELGKGVEVFVILDKKGKRLIVTTDYSLYEEAKRKKMETAKRKVQGKLNEGRVLSKYIYLPESMYLEMREAGLNRKLPYVIVSEDTVVYYY